MEIIECAHQPAKGLVHLRDVAVEGRPAGVPGRRIKRGKTRVGGNRLVRLVEADEQEERLLPAPHFLEPADRLAGDQWRGVALQHTDRPSVAHEIVRVTVARQRDVLGGEPVVEAVV